LEAFLKAAAVPDAAGAAQRLAATYRTLAELLSAEPLIVAGDGGRAAAAVLASARQLMIQAAADELLVRAPLATQEAVADFLKILIGFRRDECLVLLLLDARNALLDHQIVVVGQPDSVEVDQRRIVMRAIGCGASAIIIAHNHPSGDPRPSTADVRVSRQLADTCRSLGICLRDHLVIAGGQVRSAMFGME
jgi:DNA repair protein RadC